MELDGEEESGILGETDWYVPPVYNANDRSADRSGFKEKVKRLEELTSGGTIPGA